MAWWLEEAATAGLVGRGPCQPALESCEMPYRNSSLHSYCLQIPSRVNSPWKPTDFPWSPYSLAPKFTLPRWGWGTTVHLCGPFLSWIPWHPLPTAPPASSTCWLPCCCTGVPHLHHHLLPWTPGLLFCPLAFIFIKILSRQSPPGLPCWLGWVCRA